MTEIDLDARIRRVCARMMASHTRDAMRLLDNGVEPRTVVLISIDRHDEIAQAQAEASGDEAVGHKDTSKPVGVTGASPSDPFAPMVEAFEREWDLTRKTYYRTDKQLRRALAAALRAAPYTSRMYEAFLDANIGIEDQWRAMADALADELRGEK